MRYHHEQGHIRVSTGRKIVIGLTVGVLLFMAYTVLQAIYVHRSAQLPKPLTYGQIVNAKDRCTKAGDTWTIHMNAKTSKVVGVTCNGTKLR